MIGVYPNEEFEMLVDEAMARPVVSCDAESSLAAAARLMIDEEHGALPVVLHGSLIGIITERDILRAVADGRSPAEVTVNELMTPDPDSLEPDVDVTDAADWMLAAGYRHLPVVDDGKVLGMVSMKDIMWALADGNRCLRERIHNGAGH